MMMRPSCFLAALAVGSTPSVGVGDPLPIDQPGFEQVGKWKRADTGGKAGNILHRSSASLDDLVDEVLDGG